MIKYWYVLLFFPIVLFAQDEFDRSFVDVFPGQKERLYYFPKEKNIEITRPNSYIKYLENPIKNTRILRTISNHLVIRNRQGQYYLGFNFFSDRSSKRIYNVFDIEFLIYTRKRLMPFYLFDQKVTVLVQGKTMSWRKDFYYNHAEVTQEMDSEVFAQNKLTLKKPITNEDIFILRIILTQSKSVKIFIEGLRGVANFTISEYELEYYRLFLQYMNNLNFQQE